MNTVWTFGDSFTFGAECNSEIQYNQDSYYKKYYQESFDIWPNILGKMLGYKVKNLAVCGASNEMIMETIIDSFDYINKNDIVFIQKTLGNFEELNILWSDESNYKTNYRKFSSKLYKERNNKIFYFLKKQLLNKTEDVYIWDTDDSFVKSIQTIRQHSNYIFKTSHFSFIGHNQFANYFYNNLFKKDEYKRTI